MNRKIITALASLSLMAAPAPRARLVQALLEFDGSNPATLPAKLSLTGLYGDVSSPTRAVTPGIVAFEVNSPLWSDGSRKERFISIPAGAKVTPTDSDQYAFPDKTVLVKNFQIDSVHGDSTTRFFIETRFLILRQTQFGAVYLGLSYKWRRDQSDADLVDPDSGLDTVHQVKLGAARKGKRWRYPSQADCITCHFNRGVLGFMTPQLNRPSRANPSINQLQALFAANVLSANPLAGKTEPTFRWAGLNEAAAVPPSGLTMAEWKARSYLASNCSQCHGNHHANTFESASHDFDFFRPGRKTAFTEPDTIGGYVGKPTNVDARFPRVVYAGFPESSLVIARLLSRPTDADPFSLQMPPLATYQMDSAAAKAMKDWVCSLGKRGSACSLPAMQADSTYWSTARFHQGARPDRSELPRASFQGGLLTLSGSIASAPSLYDFRGREIPLARAGERAWRMASPMAPGVYLLRVGQSRAKAAFPP